jgi:hypothetical protein
MSLTKGEVYLSDCSVVYNSIQVSLSGGATVSLHPACGVRNVLPRVGKDYYYATITTNPFVTSFLKARKKFCFGGIGGEASFR